MANSASARKRMRQNDRQKARNRMRKSRVRTVIKSLREMIQKGDKENALKQSPTVQKMIDQATSSGIYKKNKAARMKSQLMRDVNAIS